MGLSTVVNVLPIRQLGVTLLYGDVPRPLLHPVENPLVNNRLKLPGKEDLPVASGLQLGPVLGEEIIGTAATPVHDVFVLTLAPLLPLPVGEVQVVVDVRLAVLAVPQHLNKRKLRSQYQYFCHTNLLYRMEKALSREEGVREQRLQPCD